MTTATNENGVALERRGVRIVDTFAEAFDMRASRVIVTAKTPEWARTAVQTMTGFATSVIGCKVEAALESELSPDQTPDGRPGASALLFGFDAAGLSQRLLDRIGQTILTCPTTACFDGLPDAPERVIVGGHMRHFGDKYQSSRSLAGHRYWRIPVMEGEFLIEAKFGVQKGIGGGKKVLQRACVTCHDLDEVTKFKGYYTRVQWNDIVVTMEEYGADLADGEIDILTQYLADVLGKKE